MDREKLRERCFKRLKVDNHDTLEKNINIKEKLMKSVSQTDLKIRMAKES